MYYMNREVNPGHREQARPEGFCSEFTYVNECIHGEVLIDGFK